MKRMVFFTAFIFLIMTFSPGYAEEPNGYEAETAIRTREGIHFRLPEDWPIVKRHGVLMPLPMDEYLSHKIKILMGRMDKADQKSDETLKRLEGLDQKMDLIMNQLNRIEGQGPEKAEEAHEPEAEE